MRSARDGRVAVTAVLAVVASAVVTLTAGLHVGSHSAEAATAGVHLLASTAGEPDGPTVDGIASDSVERVAFHNHAHLRIYVNGRERGIPAGVGIVPPYQIQQTADGPYVADGAAFY